MSSSTIQFAVCVLIILYFISQKRLQSKLPPGPRRLPIIGNLLQAPKDSPWVRFGQWIEKYGPIVSLDYAGTNIILIGDFETARDLLDKRANIYSDRPRSVMAHELTCRGLHILYRRFDERFLLHQRLEAPVLSPRASACYMPIQDLESMQLIRNLLTTNDYKAQFERFAASIAYMLAYGFRIISGDEWQLHTAHEVLDNFISAVQVGTWLVDSFPSLNYLPAPLAPWKKQADRWFEIETNLHMTNMHQALASESYNWCKDFVNAKEKDSMPEVELAWDLGILADAGVETTNVWLQLFTFACLAYPDWIPTAQKEIDDVVGPNRLPNFDDLKDLPYIQAVLEETFRWRHIVPGGIPHATTKGDYYKNYWIPKGSMIVPIFHVMRTNEAVFDSPLDFRPERWLGKQQQNNWGYGRRVCPGRFIAKNSIAIAVARLLWSFNIRSKDGNRPIADESRFNTGFVSAPKPFEVIFEPRSEQRRQIIENSYDGMEMDVKKIMSNVREKMVDAGLKPRG